MPWPWQRCGQGNGWDKGNPNDVEVCDGNFLDTACEEHDTCLDSLDQIQGSDGRSAEQCACDAALLGNLFAAAATEALAPTDMLCDEDFYTKEVITIPPGVKVSYSDFLSGVPGLGESPEALLLAAPFCALFVTEGDCYEAGLVQLQSVCGPLIGAITAL